MRASEAVMIGDRLSSDIRPARLLGSKTSRIAQGVRAVSVAA
jgi:FMN phosphatase YigB (HAD superfamily)